VKKAQSAPEFSPEPILKTVSLLPYQYAWLMDRAPIKIYEKSRRIGVTWASACDAATDAARINGTDWWYSGYNKEMALEFIEEAAGWARRLDQAVGGIEKVGLSDPDGFGCRFFNDQDKDILAYRIRFASGHKIVALSSRPSNFRGKQGVAIIDEAAFHDDLAGLLKAAVALTMWGGRVQIISTHNGADSEFAHLVNEVRAGRRPYSLHRTTLDDALGQGLYRAICRETGKEWSEQAEYVWRDQLLEEYGPDADEELFCIPSESGGVFLSTTLIERQMRDGIAVIRGRGPDAFEAIEQELDHVLRTTLNPLLMSVFGEDFGRSGDLTVIWPLQIENNTHRRTPFIVELRDVPYEVQRKILFYIVDRLPRFIGGAMDATGNGDWLAEQAGLKYGGTKDLPGRIIPVVMNIEWYRENMPRFKAAFEDNLLVIPKHADILADLRLIRMEKGIAKVPDARTREAGGAGQRHGDSAIAAALAWYASIADRTEYAYTPVTTRLLGGSSERAREWEEDHPSGSVWGNERSGFARTKGTW